MLEDGFYCSRLPAGTSVMMSDVRSYLVYDEDITPASRTRLDRMLAWDGWQVHEDRTRTDVDDEVRVFEYVWEGE